MAARKYKEWPTEVMDMFRKFAVAAAMLCLSATSNVFAIGLGNIEIQSRLNDPLDAVIHLTSASTQELQELKINIAPREAFDRMGIPRPSILDDVKFTVEQAPGNKALIHVTTRQPVREPYLDFLIEATWSKGRLLRQYTLLVDPPVTMPVAPPPQQVPVRQAPPTPPAAEYAPPPRARVPAMTPPAVAPVTSGGADKYGPVNRSETLWDIAKRLRPDSDISINQMMLALLRANPEAFTDNNINNLKAGAMLRIPRRDEILSLDKSAARREARRQYTDWKQARGAGSHAEQASATETAPKQPPETAPAPAPVAPAPVAPAEARLQLVAPEEGAIKGGGAPGTPAGDATSPTPEAKELLQQLTLATEEAEAGRAQTQELQSRVGKLEEQVSSMQRLIELKDEQLANLQNRLAVSNQAQAEKTQGNASPEAATPASDQTVAQGKTPAQEAATANTPQDARPGGIVDRLLDNPVLTGLGVLVAMILGGFLWASTRHRKQEDIFEDEPTLASQLSAARHDEPTVTPPRVTVSDTSLFTDVASSDVGDVGPLHGEEASDPLTEADVFIAYGRIQQAEDVIKNALQGNPGNRDFKLKLFEIYHAAGNTAAFDAQAALFHETDGEDDPDWQRVASMGYELSPANPLYETAASSRPVREGAMDFDMDLSGMDGGDSAGGTAGDDIGLDYEAGIKETGDAAENIDFNLDELNIDHEEEDITEGLLRDSDEIGTKLDLARAYMDMGDSDGARGILEEVIEEGSDDQKTEAENLISQLA
jgi:pilus assembly protein FimV